MFQTLIRQLFLLTLFYCETVALFISVSAIIIASPFAWAARCLHRYTDEQKGTKEIKANN